MLESIFTKKEPSGNKFLDSTWVEKSSKIKHFKIQLKALNMSIFNIFSCCTKQIDTSLTDVPVTNLQTLNTNVLTIGNLTFNYTTDDIDTQRIENNFS